MLQGLYAAASGMEAQQNQFDAIANDMANVDTSGYQSTQLGFQDLLYSSGGLAATGSNVATGSGATSAIIGRSQTEGSLQNTGRPLDIAITGPGYIQVRRNDGSIGLTRNGGLELDSAGQLTNQDGNPLVPPVKLPAGADSANVKIAGDGQVTVNDVSAGKIPIVDVPAPNQLQPDGDSMFSVTAGSGATRVAAGSSLVQGSLEGSNVDVGQAMSSMMQSQRAYQMSSQAIQYQDQMLEIANGIKKS